MSKLSEYWVKNSNLGKLNSDIKSKVKKIIKKRFNNFGDAYEGGICFEEFSRNERLDLVYRLKCDYKDIFEDIDNDINDEKNIPENIKKWMEDKGLYSFEEDLIKPTRYTSKSGKQVFDIIDDFDLNFYQGNVVKYVVRYKQKNGVEDLKKAKVYIDKLIELEDDRV